MAAKKSEAEWLTRKRRIDPKLDANGWKLTKARPSGTPCRTEEQQTDAGPADYALWIGGEAVGIVEAKNFTTDPRNVLTQAERYSRGLQDGRFNFDGFRAPFLYSSNGELIWFRDARHPLNRSRQIADFHKPEALRELLERDFGGACSKLLATANDHPLLRPYQRDANKAIERALSDRQRRMLVAMATGTGKTFMAVNLVWRLMHVGAAKRVLFLVDRRALAAQAVRAFSAFDAAPGQKFNQVYEVYSNRFQREDFDESEKFDPSLMQTSYLTDPNPSHTFVYVCTIQRMAINILGRGAVFDADEQFEEDADRLDIPIHAFDLIIADECHRGYSAAEQSAWRSTLDHFDAVKIGLTATPAAHTTVYFGHPVFRYDYRQAVQDGYLVDYDAVTVRSNIRMTGVFLREGEQVENVNTESGARQLDLLEDERQFDPTEIEEKVTAPDSNRKIVAEIRKYALEHEERYGRFPKTLIFAANDMPHTSHAQQLVEICRDVFGRGEAFVQKITGAKDVDRPLQRIREFRNRPNPGIAVTVDLLTTGVDIPDLEFLVFLRPVKSRILFEQMLGRGTRKGERFTDKSHFTVFDCLDGTLLSYFKNTTGITAEAPDQPSRTIVEIIEDIWQNRDRDYNTGCLVKRLHRIDKQMAAEARFLFAKFVPDGDLAGCARGLRAALKADFSGVMRTLRDTEFQELLQTYPRARRIFYVAHEAEDEVSSKSLIRDADGNKHRPEDYLSAFTRFVRDNPEKIEAIRVLLDRPRDWSAAALGELRTKLAQTKQRFSVANLQRVHELRYHRALVDIVSMIKHAADENQPLLTAEERVERAFARLTAGRNFTPDQQRWLERIRAHLVENLSIEPGDFDVVPIFSREGGLTAAKRTFGPRLESLLHQLNEAIAA